VFKAAPKKDDVLNYSTVPRLIYPAVCLSICVAVFLCVWLSVCGAWWCTPSRLLYGLPSLCGTQEANNNQRAAKTRQSTREEKQEKEEKEEAPENSARPTNTILWQWEPTKKTKVTTKNKNTIVFEKSSFPLPCE
jgi:hypothetical protein